MENYPSYSLSLTPPKLTNTASSEKGPFQEENCFFRGWYVSFQGIVDHFPYIFHGYISCMGWLGSGGSSCLVTLLGMFSLCSKYGSWYLTRYRCCVVIPSVLWHLSQREHSACQKFMKIPRRLAFYLFHIRIYIYIHITSTIVCRWDYTP